jgi:flagella basal body P-ring formation protein FlgA
VDEVINQVTLTDIGCYEPILTNIIAPRVTGSDYFDMEAVCPPLGSPTSPLTFVDVSIAVTDIAAGQIIAPSDIALRPIPDYLVPLNSTTDLRDVIGRVAIVDILQEQPITTERIAAGQ